MLRSEGIYAAIKPVYTAVNLDLSGLRLNELEIKCAGLIEGSLVRARHREHNLSLSGSFFCFYTFLSFPSQIP